MKVKKTKPLPKVNAMHAFRSQLSYVSVVKNNVIVYGTKANSVDFKGINK